MRLKLALAGDTKSETESKSDCKLTQDWQRPRDSRLETREIPKGFLVQLKVEQPLDSQQPPCGSGKCFEREMASGKWKMSRLDEAAEDEERKKGLTSRDIIVYIPSGRAFRALQ